MCFPCWRAQAGLELEILHLSLPSVGITSVNTMISPNLFLSVFLFFHLYFSDGSAVSST